MIQKLPLGDQVQLVVGLCLTIRVRARLKDRAVLDDVIQTVRVAKLLLEAVVRCEGVGQRLK